MGNLVVCCDGTWNTADARVDGVPIPTNVVRLYNALSDSDAAGQAQQRYYHPGVGTDGSLLERIKGGAMGAGLDKNVMSAYRWLGANYKTGDRIFLFGFSRGAFTVRSLGGMIGVCGLLRLQGLPDKEVWARIAKAYDGCYRKPAAKRRPWAGPDWEFHAGAADGSPLRLHFIGVWDTVGALGVPNDMALANLIDDPTDYQFHDTELSDKVDHARHAIAMDESRATFMPTLWTGVEGDPRVGQVWFPGVHSDVGGGYRETGLSDGALRWMIEEAEATGLCFNPEVVGQIRPNAMDTLHDSLTGVFKLLRTQPRRLPNLDAAPPGLLHRSVLDRLATPPIAQGVYRRTRKLAVGEEIVLPVFAAEPWNETGLYLEAGARYVFAAEGEWLDRDVATGPEGKREARFRASEIVHLAGSLLGRLEQGYKALTGNNEADFSGTRREEGMPWFALVGVVANGGEVGGDGSVSPHETFLIGQGCEYPAPPGEAVARPGYLYCFANDAWHFYDNNHGSLRLTIRRLT